MNPTVIEDDLIRQSNVNEFRWTTVVSVKSLGLLYTPTFTNVIL